MFNIFLGIILFFTLNYFTLVPVQCLKILTL